jgi:hypothetical protein
MMSFVVGCLLWLAKPCPIGMTQTDIAELD